jgi:hypothetical protein
MSRRPIRRIGGRREDMSELKTFRVHQWRSLAIFAVLTILCALSFLRYLGWAAYYSGNPSPGLAAGRNAELFLVAFVILEVLAALVIASRIRLEGTFSSNAVRLVARYATALLISVLSTGIVVGVLVTIGSRYH